MTNTCRPSTCSDLRQSLFALRDLVENTPVSLEPVFMSALQQARMVLRRHEVTPDENS